PEAGHDLQEEPRKYRRGITVEALLTPSLAEAAELDRLRAHRAGAWIFSPESWEAVAGRARSELEEYPRAHPLRAGMPREELKSRLGLQPAAFAPVVAELATEGVLAERDGSLALPGHSVTLDPGGGPAARLLEALGREPF